MHSLKIRIPIDMHAELSALSKREKRSLNDLVCESLKEFLIVRQFCSLRGKTLPFAKVQGLLTDKDVFKTL